MMDRLKDNRLDKFALFVLAGLSIAGLIGLGTAIVLWGMPETGEGSEGLLNVIATGLLLFSREIVGAIRAAWQDQQVGQMSDRLHASAPVEPPPPATPAPRDAKEAADQVADAAANEAATITEETKP
ncbi:MAG: hypothetical protein QOH47_2422 [Sphingomonadales bacterium]|jgi:hypothetical protein|nr:hypothetical protein [Sphingomonadales bacterium]